MGKQTDQETYLQEIVSYGDVAGKGWPELWKKAKRAVPLRIIVMGTSMKLSYSATVKEFKKIMLDEFGFAEDSDVAQSEILVVFSRTS